MQPFRFRQYKDLEKGITRSTDFNRFYVDLIFVNNTDFNIKITISSKIENLKKYI